MHDLTYFCITNFILKIKFIIYLSIKIIYNLIYLVLSILIDNVIKLKVNNK